MKTFPGKPHRILIGMPVRQPEIKLFLLESLLEASYSLAHKNILMQPFFWVGDPLVSHARNVIFAHFLLRTECDDLVFVDDDVSWAPGTLTRLVEHDVDMVAGIYRHKKDPESYPINWLPSDGPQLTDPETKLLQVADVPFGFCKLSRAAAQKMYDAAKDRPYFHANAPDLECRTVFDIVYANGQYYGEDYVFCQKWRSLGGKVWVDPEMAVNHTGFKIYQGHLGNFLREQTPPTIEYAMADVKRTLDRAA